jgi:flagellar hook-basal body complex protein FliE
MAIHAIPAVGASAWQAQLSSASKATQAPAGASFADTLEQALDSVNESQQHADDKLAELAAGKTPDLHGTMIALQEADITLRTMVSVRDKVVDAYQQVMNMQI